MISDISSGVNKIAFSKEISFNNVSFKPKKRAQNVSFKIKKGETVAIVGHSGAGKQLQIY